MVNNDYLISAVNVDKYYNNKIILSQVSLEIREGDIITIVGPNGAGKSTLAKILCGIETIDSGTLTINKNLNIAYVPQKVTINHNIPITVKDFIALHPSQKELKKTIEEVAENINIKNILNQSMHSLSGGQLQRAFLARAFISSPDVLILDEPEQGIDIQGRIELYEIIKKINLETSMAIILIAHDLHFVMKATKHVICLNKHICCEGKPENITKDQNYTNLFGPKATNLVSLYFHNH